MTAITFQDVKRTSVNAIKTFIGWNVSVCDWLVRRWPHIYGGIEERYQDFENHVRHHSGHQSRVCELGGVDRPLLKRGDVEFFVGIDVDDQNGKAHQKYDTFYKGSVEDTFPNGEFDLIYSKTLLEHVPNNTLTFTNIHKALKEGGETVHYFPSKNALYALFIRIVGNDIQRKVIQFLYGKENLSTIGYPAFFDRCESSEIRRLLTKLGFKDVDVKCYYRANSYYTPLFPVFMLVSWYENVCKAFGWEKLATGLKVSARR